MTSPLSRPLARPIAPPLAGAVGGYGTSGGGDFGIDVDYTAVADGQNIAGVAEPYAYRTYHAFPSLIKLGSYYVASLSTFTGQLAADSTAAHTARRGATVVLRSTDLTGTSWEQLHRWECKKPDRTVALVVGDYEYRYGGLVDLGSGIIGIVVHYYEVTNTSDLLAPEKNRVLWATSNNGGVTWSELTPLEYSVGDPQSIVACQPIVWQGYVWIPCYKTTTITTNFVYRAPLADVLRGSETWDTVPVGNYGSETGFIRPVQASDSKLYLAIRMSGLGPLVLSINAANAGDQTPTWTQEVANWIIDKYGANQPEICKLPTGRYISQLRGDLATTGTGQHSLGWAASLGAEFDREFLLPVDRSDNAPPALTRPVPSAQKPGWNDMEKARYASFVPLGGELAAYLFSTEAHYQWVDDNTLATYGIGREVESDGGRSSVWFGHAGAGIGKTPRGQFVKTTALPAVPTLLDLPGLLFALLPGGLVNVGGGDMTWTCPVSGFRWKANNTTKPGYSATGSPNGNPCATNTALSTKYLLFDTGVGTLPTAVHAVYYLLKHTTGAPGAAQGIDRYIIGYDASGDFVPTAYKTNMKYMWRDGLAVTDAGAYPVPLRAPEADKWHVFSIRRADKITSGLPPLQPWLMNISSAAGWDGSLAAFVAFNRNLTEREDAYVRAYLATL